MAGVAKRKGPTASAVPSKRQRIVVATPSTEPQVQSDESDNDEYQDDAAAFSEIERTADTPATPLTPSTKKFPSQYKTLRCTWEGCNKTFNRPSRLQNHLNMHSNQRTFICKYEGCDKSYFEDKHLQQHIKGSHTHERKHVCEWEGCGKSFMTATRLRRHIDAHQGNDRFRCTGHPPCNQSFRKHNTLQRHIRSEHLNLTPFPCRYVDPITNEACGAGFDGSTGLKRHEEREHGLWKFFCLQCVIPGAFDADGNPANLGFTTNGGLQTHIRKEHVNLTCMWCDKTCSSQYLLQQHIESQHSGVSVEERKTIACTYVGCDKIFTRQSNLNQHINTAHLGMRYICGEFDTTTSLGIEHFKLEEGCEKDFSSKANLEDHIRTAHLHMPTFVNRNRPFTSSRPISRSRRTSTAPSYETDSDSAPAVDPSDLLNDEEYDPVPKGKASRKGGRKQASGISHLLGEKYDPTQHEGVPPPTRRQTRQRAAKNVPGPAFRDAAFGDFEFPGVDLGVDMNLSGGEILGNGFEPLPQYQNIPQPDLRMDYQPNPVDDVDWEIHQQALAGGPFWVSGNDGLPTQQHTWPEEEMEMRRLIGDENIQGNGPVYPTL